MSLSQPKPLPISTVDIRPEVTILSVLPHLNYRSWFALAEFVDNSLQSFLAHLDTTRNAQEQNASLLVEIEISVEGSGQIVIRDQAGGISEGDFPRAFRPAEIPADRSGLSEFGMGMKSAACWFAKSWRVRTCALGEAVERTVSFDIDRIVSGRINKLSVMTRPAAIDAHYTEIVLRDLHHPPKGSRTISKIKEHLASIYRVFLRNGSLHLMFNGDRLSYSIPAILVAPYYKKLDGPNQTWRKEIDFDFGEGQRVCGFAALREPASTTHAGFALFRRNRLIQGSADETYRPIQIFGNSNSYRYQRLFGELHLEGFEVSHTKDGFRWEEYEELFLDLLRDELEKPPLNLLDQAEGHRAKTSRKSIEARAKTATDNVADVVKSDVQPVLEKEVSEPAQPVPLPPTVPKSDLQASERTVRIEDGRQTWEVTIQTTVDPAIGEWLRLGERTTRQQNNGEVMRCIAIAVSLAHPFVAQFVGANNENVELFLRFAAAIALSLVLASDGGGTGQEFALHHLNTLLRDALSHSAK